jgi:hypothetical protein
LERILGTVLIGESATIDEIDEALTHAQQLAPEERGPGWYAFVDRLLEMRGRADVVTQETKPTKKGPRT